MQDRLSEVLNLWAFEVEKTKDQQPFVRAKQLVAIASVLVMEPKILIADEISSPLDEDNKSLSEKYLRTMPTTDAV